MDGPAPLAKLLEQRRRRRRESVRNELAEKAEGEAAAAAAAAADEGEMSGSGDGGASRRRPPPLMTSSKNAVSPLNLTTGTIFMLEVHNSLVYYICQRLSDPRFRQLSFELSDSTVKGEGELKILSRLVRAAAAGASHPGETHVVVGGDSDLIVMAIASGQRHVTLWDDLPSRHHRNSPVFNRDQLEAVWRKHHLPENATQQDVADLGLNLALLAIICSGNDYLPGCQGMALQNKGRPGLWSLYLDMRKQPQWKDRSLVLRRCDDGEEMKEIGGVEQQETTLVHGGESSAVSIDKMMLSALLRRYNEQRLILGGDGIPGATNIKQSYVDGSWNWGFENNTSTRKSNSSSNNTCASAFPHQSSTLYHHSREPANPERYIHGLEWTLAMYATGSVSDYRFSYPGAPPMLSALLEELEKDEAVVEFAATADEKENNVNGAQNNGGGGDAVSKVSSPRREDLQPLIPAACALALLPARSRRQAATALRHLMDPDSPIAEIYAICEDCQKIAGEVRSVSFQLDDVRKQLVSVQDIMSAAAPDADGAHDAAADLAAASEVFEAAQENLKVLLRELSKTQQEHFKEKHPFKPFPTEALEAAVMAVPREHYPPRERRLARFGREMVFRSAEYASLSVEEEGGEVVVGEQREHVNGGGGGGGELFTSGGGGGTASAPPPFPRQDGGGGSFADEEDSREYYAQSDAFSVLPGWLKDASRFVVAYPRLGSHDVVQGAAYGVIRKVLPLHPYMQPHPSPNRTLNNNNNNRGGGRNSTSGSSSTTSSSSGGRAQGSSAMYMSSQLRRYGNTNSGRSTTTITSGVVPYFGTGGGGAGLQLPGALSHHHHQFYHRPSVAGAGVNPSRGISSSSNSSRMLQSALKTCARVLPRLRALW